MMHLYKVTLAKYEDLINEGRDLVFVAQEGTKQNGRIRWGSSVVVFSAQAIEDLDEFTKYSSINYVYRVGDFETASESEIKTVCQMMTELEDSGHSLDTVKEIKLAHELKQKQDDIDTLALEILALKGVGA